jgi:hypothetical protein
MKTVNNDLYFVAKHFFCRIDKTVVTTQPFGIIMVMKMAFTECPGKG